MQISDFHIKITSSVYTARSRRLAVRNLLHSKMALLYLLTDNYVLQNIHSYFCRIQKLASRSLIGWLAGASLVG